MRRCPASFAFVVASVCVVLVAAGRDARAQAWVDDKGTLGFSLDYNLGISDKVVVDKGSNLQNAGSMTHEFTLGAEYVPVQHLAVDVALPLVLIEYTGVRNALSAHPGGGRYDDGNLHTTLTDLRAGVRYQLLDEPLALTPHIAVSIPVANYETVGNAVGGRHLKALHLGLSAGRVFAESAYVHALYEFSLVEKYDRTMETAQFGQNRSDFTATVGYRLLDQRLDLHLDVNGRITHGGMNFSEFGQLPMNDQLYHDPILAETIVLVGGGVGYQLTNDLWIKAGARLFVAGVNTQNANVYVFGVSWTAL